MPKARPRSQEERPLAVAAAVAGALTAAAVVSDLLEASFWARHAMLTSLLASLLVVVITVAVLNELLDRRDRRRWSLLAQSVLFALVQSARVTWTSLIEVLRLSEVQSGALEPLLDGARIALDTGRVSVATRELLADPERRLVLQQVLERLGNHAGEVIASWAPVMVGAATYAALLDRHVELQGRLEWVSAVLTHREPAPDRDGRSRRLNRANVATEQADQIDDDWIHDMVVAITALAARLDHESRDLAFSLVPSDWWAQRTQALTTQEEPPPLTEGFETGRQARVG